jgi:hypothetical protein
MEYQIQCLKRKPLRGRHKRIGEGMTQMNRDEDLKGLVACLDPNWDTKTYSPYTT